MLPVVVVVAVLAAYLAGLVSFKLKSRWCPRCGTWTATRRPDSGHV